MNQFTNDVISIESLPKYEEAEMTPVQKKYWTVMVVNLLITFLIIGGIIIAVSLLSDKSQYLVYILSGYLVIMLTSFFLQKISFSKRSYALRERDIIYRHGILSTLTTIVPFNRIQHVGINEGLISRYYKMAQLQIYTAGGAASDLKISGLLKADAEQIKEAIMIHIVNPVETLKNEIADI